MELSGIYAHAMPLMQCMHLAECTQYMPFTQCIALILLSEHKT